MAFSSLRPLGAAMMIALASCAGTSSNPCAAPLTSALSERLYFGTATPHGLVSDVDWQIFVSQVIGPAFPQGFTTWDANGQWRGRSGETVAERSHVVEFIHDPKENIDARLRTIIEEYRRRFEQEAVMHTREQSCVAF